VPDEPRPAKDDEMRAKCVQWTWEGDGYSAVPHTYKNVDAGLYAIEPRPGRIVFLPKEIKIDDLLRFPDSKADKILKEISDFWERHDYFQKYGFLHRRGYLFYGPAGGGKTCLVQQIIS